MIKHVIQVFASPVKLAKWRCAVWPCAVAMSRFYIFSSRHPLRLFQVTITSPLKDVVSLSNAQLVTSSRDVELISLKSRDAAYLISAQQRVSFLWEVKANVTSATHSFRCEFNVEMRFSRDENETLRCCVMRREIPCERYQTLCRTKTEVMVVEPLKHLQVLTCI